MPYVFQTYLTRVDQETGKRVFRLDEQGNKIPHKKWRFAYVDWQGKRKVGTGYSTKRKTENFSERVQFEQDEIRKGFRPPPKPKENYGRKSFADFVDEYLEWGDSQGGRQGRAWGKVHLRMRSSHLRWWQEKLGLEALADLEDKLPRVESELRELQRLGRSGKTLMNYSDALRSFCNWCVRRGYLESNPIIQLKSFNAVPRLQRRAMSRDEIHKILEVAPEKRKLLYEVAFCTGLRAGELGALRVKDLPKDAPALILRPEVTKNRKAGKQFISREIHSRLLETVKGKSPDDPLLEVPSHPAREMDKDLKAAGIPKQTPEGKVDFHSCRTAYVTFVLGSGADPKEAQTLARHSTPTLTMNVYARAHEARLAEIAERVGKTVLLQKRTVLHQKRNITGTYPESDDQEIPVKSSTKVVEAAGIEPASDEEQA